MKRTLIVLAAVLALGVGSMAVVGAAAQSNGQDGPVKSLLSRVAGKLGISEDQLTTAVKDSETDIINEKLAAGEITQQQADKAKKRIANGDLRFPGGKRHHGGMACRIGAKFAQETATILGVDVSVVADGLQQGKSLAEIAQDHGKSADDYKAALSAAVKAKLDAKVASGDITQKRADERFAKFNEYVDRIINHKPDPNNVAKCREHLNGGEPGKPASPTPDASGT